MDSRFQARKQLHDLFLHRDIYVIFSHNFFFLKLKLVSFDHLTNAYLIVWCFRMLSSSSRYRISCMFHFLLLVVLLSISYCVTFLPVSLVMSLVITLGSLLDSFHHILSTSLEKGRK